MGQSPHSNNFFLPKNFFFFGYWLEEGANKKYNYFQNDYLGGVKRKRWKTCAMQNRGNWVLILMVDFAPRLISEIMPISFFCTLLAILRMVQRMCFLSWIIIGLKLTSNGVRNEYVGRLNISFKYGISLCVICWHQVFLFHNRSRVSTVRAITQ
jgi:hypothetical protein